MPSGVLRRRSSVAALLLIVAVTVVHAAAQDPPPLLARPFEPRGDKLPVPGAPGCFIYIAAWEAGSWYDPNEDDGQKVPVAWRVPKAADTRDARWDVDEVKRWLSAMLEQSEDMRNKTRAACWATGYHFVQIGVVRDDPEAGPGAWTRGTPVILVDMGDIEKAGKHAETPRAGNPSIQGVAARTVSSLLPASLIAHELDHAQRAGQVASRAEREWQANVDEKFHKQPPPAGMVFVPADPAEQRAVEPVGRIVDAVRQLRARGALMPDSDDADEYAHDLVQWSVWTHREAFDETHFRTAFVDHVRKNFAAAGDTWTREMQQAVTALAPGRWTAIQKVLAAAAALERW